MNVNKNINKYPKHNDIKYINDVPGSIKTSIYKLEIIYDIMALSHSSLFLVIGNT